MEKELIFEGRKVHYRREGKGPLVMLVHGFGEDSTVWDSQVQALKDKFSLLVPDLPGSGKSEVDPTPSMESMAAALKAILDIESGGYRETPPGGAEKLTMIGHSMGGYITLAFAEKYPESLQGFALFHSTAYADSGEKKTTRQKGIEFIREHGAFEFLKAATPNLFSAKTRDKRPELIDKQIGSLRNFSANTLVLYYQAMMQRPDRTAILRNTGLPVLFVMGPEDSAVPMKDMLEQCHLPRIAYIYELHESGHMGMLEETERSNQILATYLSDINH